MDEHRGLYGGEVRFFPSGKLRVATAREVRGLLNSLEIDTDVAQGRAGAAETWIDTWAGRIALLSVVAILAVTLFPFNFSPQATALRRIGPFLSWFDPMAKNWLSWSLNVVLFLPFGFGLAWWARQKRWSRAAVWPAIVVGGCALSFLVELLQLYVPRRSSSWDDVVMNTLGSFVGLCLFEIWGGRLLGFIEGALSDLTASLER
jgi:VanZ family protein